jgi:hypothetical protein
MIFAAPAPKIIVTLARAAGRGSGDTMIFSR